ncbi:hypothetical protein ACFVP3_28940 [Streptomyces sp. NPDC057806]|uniref:hypothetical protein n=1 Tax=Streptomyces sp. NPDC057806 TaxID=3346255 RepID=UPI003690E373
MFRGTTDVIAISALAAALFTRRFFAPAASFAPAHTVCHAKARARALRVFQIHGR